MSVSNLVRSATFELSSTPYVLPAGARIAFLALHRIHRIWRWIRLGNVYRDPNNFAQLAAGHGLNYMLGDSAMVRLSAISVLIASRILHSVDEFEQLQRSWVQLKDAFNNHYAAPVNCSWSQPHGLFSLSTVIWIKTNGKSLIIRVQWIAIGLFKIGKHSFLLSMRLVDAIEAFSLSPAIRNEGINLLFVNSGTCLTKLNDNKDLLLDSLESNKEIIEKILQGLGSLLTAEQLIKTVSSSLESAGTLQRRAKTVNQSVGEFVSACGKKWTYELFREIGLRHLVPKTMVPPVIPPWEQPERRRIDARFPPRGWTKKAPPPVLPPKKEQKNPKKPDPTSLKAPLFEIGDIPLSQIKNSKKK
jgi:hypothetical protein